MRLQAEPCVARYRTNASESDLDKIVASPVAFTIAVRTSGVAQWEAIGHRELEEVLRKAVVRFPLCQGSCRLAG